MATNGNEPATKADLTKLRDDVHSDMAKLRDSVNGDMAKLRDDLVEQMRDSETKLLSAFYAFAESNQKRLVQMDATDAILISRVATLETRLLEVEKRLNIPPTQ
ncbi:MAG: hypothetical protein LAP38_11110 [Acidobacteriia bacterium]|nr:hypothetical protein [Terriglobia bacterium]